MLDTLTLEDFTPAIGRAFRITHDDGVDLGVVLTRVDALGGDSAGRVRTPFSLLFHAPVGTSALPQGIYRVDGAGVDALDIFIVPLGPDAHGMAYEAIFT